MEYQSFCRFHPNGDAAVLLIHGICGSPDHFLELLPLIPEEWSVYNLLLEGHGAGVKEFAGASMESWKRQVSGQLDDILLRHKKVLVIGHSMGTLFAIGEAVARENADMCLFLLNCPLRIQYPPKTMLMSLRVALGKYKDTDVQAKAMHRCCGIRLTPKLWQYMGWIPRFLELFGEVRKTRKLIPRLEAPCRCFQGKQDELVPSAACKVLARNPKIRVTVLPGSSHYYYAPEDMHLLRSALINEMDQMRSREET